MAVKTPLQLKYEALTKIETSNLLNALKALTQPEISERTFYRDLKATPNSIPHVRLQVYAGLFACEVSDLIDHFVKVKSIVKKSITKKVGLR